jgi:F-type H+-transporting ATPase subunit gamma
MSELVAMRQRIKAIETIKKITHAMRLISMSTHSRLRSRKGHLRDYKEALVNTIASIKRVYPQWNHPVFTPTIKNEKQKNLIVIIGSQKGLCGNFNHNLFAFVKKNLPETPYSIILVGKKAVETKELESNSIALEFSDFTQNKLLSIAQRIADYIWHAQIPFSSVILFYNFPRTFFMQVPKKIQLLPFEEDQFQKNFSNLKHPEAFRWEQSPETILDFLAHKLIQSFTQDILFDALIAEQAARFVAMDNSTRNASNLLDTTRLAYNKTRQAKITRELTDLVASFQENLGT